MTDVPENVKRFAERCADIVGKTQKEDFIYNAQPFLAVCDSPIEQLFYAAIKTIVKVNNYEGQQNVVVDDMIICDGIFIIPQFEIDKYRVDFAILYLEAGKCPTDRIFHDDLENYYKKRKILIAELDGHEFHDKDEKQRRYEKARDRKLQKLGFQVFRYTGSEIFQNPFRAAAECIAYLTEETEEELMASVKVV